MEETYASRPLLETSKRKLEGLRVLLVDDSEDNRFLFRRILDSAGARVDLAVDGAAAIRIQNQQHFDVIIMDIRMPNLDGYEATRQIRASGFRGPIIALTAHALPDEEKRCREAGCSHFRLKPIDRNSLVSAVERAATEKH